MQAGKTIEGQLHAEKAAAQGPDNVWYQIFLADIYQNNELGKKAVNIYEDLIKKHPGVPDYYFNLASAYQNQKKFSEAIKVYDQIEKLIGVTPELCLQKKRFYLKIGKPEKAAEEIKKLISIRPNEVEYYGMLAELYQANNMGDQALEVYQQMLAVDPDNGIVHLNLADYYRQKGDKEKSFKELKASFASKGVDVETKLRVLASYYSLIDQYPELKSQSAELLQILQKMHPEEATVYAFTAEFLHKDKNFEKARENYRKAIELKKDNFAIWQALMSVEIDLNDFTALEKESNQALELFPNQPLVYYLNGISKLQLKKYNESITVFKMGAKLIVDNNNLLSEFYANIGDAYNKLEQAAPSNEAFDKALVLNPRNVNTLNNYSYYLSMRGDSLQKAERMSKLSNELEPGNSYYQDTYAWILYKMGKLSDAKIWIEKALESRKGDSGVIWEHYGDILFSLGDEFKAVEYWNKAQKAGGGSENLDKKIKEKKLVDQH